MSRFAIRKIVGAALPLRGDAIDTDRIYPARFLRTMTFEGAEKYLFADDRAANENHPLNQKKFQAAKILVVESDFGGGSSREHAPQAIKRYGFRAIVGASFGEIFFFNAVAIGLPCVSIAALEAKNLLELIECQPKTRLEIDLADLTLKTPVKTIALNMFESARQQFLQGAWNSTLTLLQAGDLIEKTAARLPYLKFLS
jgi:3-isopropylmalate/(R)-2-methylmalate dehydratase small subunit